MRIDFLAELPFRNQDVINLLIICIMMDEFMQAWTDYQDRSPLEHRDQNQGDNLRTGASGGILSDANLLLFVFGP